MAAELLERFRGWMGFGSGGVGAVQAAAGGAAGRDRNRKAGGTGQHGPRGGNGGRMPAGGSYGAEAGPESAVTAAQARAIRHWYSLYAGTPPWKQNGVYSLGLPQAICRELRRVVSSEMNVTVSGSPRGDFLCAQLTPALERIQNGLELGLALGGMALKPYVSVEPAEPGAAEGGSASGAGEGDSAAARFHAGSCSIGLDVVSAAAFYPARFDDGGRCVAGFFRSEPLRSDADGAYYIRLEQHDYRAGTCTIRNRAFRSSPQGERGQEVPLETVPEWAGISPEVTIEHVTGPLFGYFRAPAVNTVSPGSQVGASIYGGPTEELLREADLQWSRYMEEFTTARRRIMAADEAVRQNLPGGVANPLALDSLYVAMPYDNGDDFFHEFSPALRDEGFYNGLQAVLRRIEFNCGLAYGDLSDPSTTEKTAAEVISARSRKYNTVWGIEKALQTAIAQAVYGMDVYATLYELAPAGAYDLQITWDDSILEDTAAERSRDMEEVAAGLLSKEAYRMKWYGEDAATARRTLEKGAT